MEAQRYVVMGAGEVGYHLARVLTHEGNQVTVIERDRSRAEELAENFPRCEILPGDAIDLALLQAECISDARTVVVLLSNDEADILACLLARELGVRQVIAMVQRTEMVLLMWLGRLEVYSIAALFTVAFWRR